MIVMAISEHVENAGVHSGDATLVLPPQDLNQKTIHNVEVIAHSVAKALTVSGNFYVYSIYQDRIGLPFLFHFDRVLSRLSQLLALWGGGGDRLIFVANVYSPYRPALTN